MALQDRTGQKVPSVVFRTRVGDTWKDVSTDDLFKGKKVVVFSLPGAFTPTCSSSHLPRYNELAPVFKKYGVDDILVVSVNVDAATTLKRMRPAPQGRGFRIRKRSNHITLFVDTKNTASKELIVSDKNKDDQN